MADASPSSDAASARSAGTTASGTAGDMQARVREALADRFGEDVARAAELERRGGHASLRIYWYITLPPAPGGTDYPRGDRTLRALALPAPEDAPAAAGEWTFVNVQRYLHRVGLAVPDIDHVDLGRGVLLIEDLSDERFEDVVLAAAASGASEAPHGSFGGDAVFDRYREVIDMVLKLHRAARRSMSDPSFGQAGDCVAFERRFDRELLRWELGHYLEWGLQARLGREAVAPHEETLSAAFDRLTDALLDLPQTLALRDLQCRNVMRKAGRWYLIDFQDALMGPFVYDLVALLRDSYLLLDDALVDDLLAYYVEEGARAELPWCEDAAAVRRAFHLQTVQRKLKDAGRFIFIERERGNDEFLPYYEPSVAYAKRALAHLPAFDDLRTTLADVEPAFSDAG